MSVSLSIKNVPDGVVDRLRQRAERNHRSLQGELLSIISDPWVLGDPETIPQGRPADLGGIVEAIAALGLATLAESVAMIRADRDDDHGRR